MTDSATVRDTVRVVLAELEARGIAVDIVLGAAFAALVGEMVSHSGPRCTSVYLRSSATVLDLAEDDRTVERA